MICTTQHLFQPLSVDPESVLIQTGDIVETELLHEVLQVLPVFPAKGPVGRRRSRIGNLGLPVIFQTFRD